MKKLRTAVAVFATVFALGIAGAPSAAAAEFGQTCGTWSHASKSGTGCVLMNQTTLQGVQGKARFSFAGNQSNNCIGVEFDYVRLLRNGVVVQSNNANSGPSCVGQTFSTGFSQGFGQCFNFKATARYRFLHSVGGPGFLSDGHTSGWIVRTTAAVQVCF